MAMKEIPVQELMLNPMHKIAKQWMLITAGNAQRGYNTMTASWGHLGSIWGIGGGAPTSVIYIRPQRYTKEFVDAEPLYTLSFFPMEYKKELGYLGSHSGRDSDKVADVGLTTVFDQDTTYFAEAELVLICRKRYHGSLTKEGFADNEIVDTHYPQHDFHDFYIGEILKVLVKE